MKKMNTQHKLINQQPQKMLKTKRFIHIKALQGFHQQTEHLYTWCRENKNLETIK